MRQGREGNLGVTFPWEAILEVLRNPGLSQTSPQNCLFFIRMPLGSQFAADNAGTAIAIGKAILPFGV